jgi:hypothetical protein
MSSIACTDIASLKTLHEKTRKGKEYNTQDLLIFKGYFLGDFSP